MSEVRSQIGALFAASLLATSGASAGNDDASNTLSISIGDSQATLANGGFETGDFTGWVVADLAQTVVPLAVAGAGVDPGFGLFLSEPTEGDFAAVHGFDGAAGTISIAQDVFLPVDSNIRFDYRAGWDLTTFCTGCADREISLEIQAAGGGPSLASFEILTARAGTAVLDTGASTETFDLSAFTGQGVRLSFEAVVPDDFSGAGFFQLDRVGIPEPSKALLGLTALATLAALLRRHSTRPA